MAIIMAIAVIVIIGTIMALNMALTAQTTKRTSDLYLYEQTMLLSKSATEYALLRIAQSNPCAYTGESFTQDSFYNIDISVQYIYTAGVCLAQYATVTTPEQNGSVLLDVTVTVPNNINVTTEPIRYFRRTIQKL